MDAHTGDTYLGRDYFPHSVNPGGFTKATHNRELFAVTSTYSVQYATIYRPDNVPSHFSIFDQA